MPIHSLEALIVLMVIILLLSIPIFDGLLSCGFRFRSNDDVLTVVVALGVGVLRLAIGLPEVGILLSIVGHILIPYQGIHTLLGANLVVGIYKFLR